MGADVSYNREYYLSHRESIKARKHNYYANNKDKVDATATAWREKNREHVRDRCKKRYKINRGEVLALVKLWQMGHPERVKAIGIEWRANHPDECSGHRHKRRALERNTAVEKFLVSEIYERDGWVCQLCKKEVNKNLTYPNPLSKSLDHIIPLSKGGEHSRKNVHLAHLVCNLKAGTGGIKQTLLF